MGAKSLPRYRYRCVANLGILGAQRIRGRTMQLARSVPGITNRTGGVLLALLAAITVIPPVHADVVSAFKDYQRRDYPHAFQEFLALAQLGQPLAQFDVATMYQTGQGTPANETAAYAWATLAAASGEARGKALADAIRPKLPAGAEQAAGALTLAYTDSALQQTLLPDQSAVRPQGWPTTPLDPALDCRRTALHIDAADHPTARVQGTLVIGFTLMPDGLPRFPRIIQAVPAGVFEGVAKTILLRSQFSRAPAGSAPVQCFMPYSFTFTNFTQDTIGDFAAELGYRRNLPEIAQAGNPYAQLVYGLLLDGLPLKHGDVSLQKGGLPWLIKAAQAGLPVAQYEVGHRLLIGQRCWRDDAKGLKWMQMAAEQGEPTADVTLAMRLLRGTPSAANVAQAKEWLERGAAPSNEGRIPNSSDDARLLLAAVLAATAEASLRDPSRALDLLKKVQDVDEDPTPYDIRAAAEAARGDFSHAVHSEQSAISRATKLGWDLSPLQQRLSLYQSSKPWYGSLLEF